MDLVFVTLRFVRRYKRVKLQSYYQRSSWHVTYFAKLLLDSHYIVTAQTLLACETAALNFSTKFWHQSTTSCFLFHEIFIFNN